MLLTSLPKCKVAPTKRNKINPRKVQIDVDIVVSIDMETQNSMEGDHTCSSKDEFSAFPDEEGFRFWKRRFNGMTLSYDHLTVTCDVERAKSLSS